MDLVVSARQRWFESIVPILLERFVLAVLATLTVAIMLANPFSWDRLQQSGAIVGLIGVAMFVAGTAHRLNKPPEPPPAAQEKTVDKPKEQPPTVQQHSTGPNSPSIVTTGPNSPVIIHQPPTMLPKIEGLTVSHRQVPSSRTDAPYAIESVVQVQAELSPFGIGFVTDEAIIGGQVAMPGNYIFQMMMEGTLNEAPTRSYFVSFSSPAVTPRQPLIVTLFATRPFRIIKVTKVSPF